MAGEVIVDALPYIDQGYDEPGIREAVCICKTYTYCLIILMKFTGNQYGRRRKTPLQAFKKLS